MSLEMNCFYINSIRNAGDIFTSHEVLVDVNDELIPSTVVNISILSMQGNFF